MKKIIYLIAILGVALTGCNPNEEIYNEIDAQESPIVGDASFTLSDEDYDDLDLSFGNFNSVDDAKSMLPAFLSDKYPVWGAGSSALVTFKIYSKVDTYSENIYELSDADHNAITGGSFGNFSSGGDIYDYVEATYPTPEEGDFVSLRYRYWAGSESTLTDGFYYENGNWNKIKGFTEAEYAAMGESFPNFSSHDEAELKMPIALLDVYKFDPQEKGDIVQAMYELYKGGGVTKSYTKNFVFDGMAWSVYTNVAEETVQFGHDGTTWVPDNTIKYTLTGGDVTFISDAFINVSGFEGPADNVGFFGSFDRRASSGNYWSDAMLLEAFNALLENGNFVTAEGQKYVLTFVIYNGSTTNETKAVIKTGGVWVYQ